MTKGVYFSPFCPIETAATALAAGSNTGGWPCTQYSGGFATCKRDRALNAFVLHLNRILTGEVRPKSKEETMDNAFREQLLDKLESIGSLHPRAGLTYALDYFSKLARLGIGMSKREVTRQTKQLSPFIHSWNTFDRYLGIAKEFVLFCRDHQVTRLHKLTYATVEAFLMAKIAKERVENTLQVNMCALRKFFNGCNRPDLRDQLADDFPRFKELAQPGGTIHAFDNLERLIEQITKRAELSAVIVKLQYITGARIHEVRTMELGETTITIHKGKGGRKRVLDFSNRLDELAEVKNLIIRLEELAQGIDWQAYCQDKHSPYQGHVKAACRSLRDIYAGAHGLRANHAQELRKKLEAQGLSPEKIELIITQDLGHNRRSMARHYLGV
jgi:integrase